VLRSVRVTDGVWRDVQPNWFIVIEISFYCMWVAGTLEKLNEGVHNVKCRLLSCVDCVLMCCFVQDNDYAKNYYESDESRGDDEDDNLDADGLY